MSEQSKQNQWYYNNEANALIYCAEDNKPRKIRLKQVTPAEASELQIINKAQMFHL